MPFYRGSPAFYCTVFILLFLSLLSFVLLYANIVNLLLQLFSLLAMNGLILIARLV